MADTRQNKIFVTRDEGVTFEGRELDFKPNNIRYQGRTVPNSDKGALSQHIMGYETDTQSVREHCLSTGFLGHCITVYPHTSTNMFSIVFPLSSLTPSPAHFL